MFYPHTWLNTHQGLSYAAFTLLFLTVGSYQTGELSTLTPLRRDQSGTCTPQQDLEGIQCLRELPAERYEVLEGEDVQMRCRVAHQKGKTQWRAGNFLLGYIRSIPSWPRYSMLGDPRLGVHDLLITNVTNEDAGVYECQVSPANGQSPLRRQTTLSILIKPTTPVIIAPSGEPQPSLSGQLIVPIHHLNGSTYDTLRLICQSTGGRPTPVFEWFHNGIAILTETKMVGRNHTSSLSDGLLSVEQREKEQWQAELVLKRDKLHTGDRLVCLVSNKATLRSKHLSQQKLRAELFVVIHSPPGAPEIIDWPGHPNKTSVLNVGDQLKATCRSMPAGSPLGEIAWRWERPQKARYSMEDRGIQIANTIPLEYVVDQYANDKLLSKVRIPNITESQHGLDIVCAVKHQVGPEKTARLPILVRYGPKTVHIHGPEETIGALKQNIPEYLASMRTGRNSKSKESENERASSGDQRANTYFVYKDRPQYLLCMTGPFFDRTTVTWLGLSNSSGLWHDISPVESLSHVVEVSEHNYVHVSIVQLVSTNDGKSPLQWVSVDCRASTLDRVGVVDGKPTGSVVVRAELAAYEPPGKPQVIGYKHGTLFREGSKVTLNCEATVGKPRGQLHWLSTKNLEDNIGTLDFLPNTTTEYRLNGRMHSILTVIVNRDTNGRVFRCAAENAGYRNAGGQISDPVIIGVAYASTNISMTILDETGQQVAMQDPKSLEQNEDSFTQVLSPSHSLAITGETGMKLVFKCRVDVSNPQPKISWRIYRCSENMIERTLNFSVNEIKHEKMTNAEEKRCRTVPISVTSEQKFPEFVQSEITLVLNWSHHGDIVECYVKDNPSWESTGEWLQHTEKDVEQSAKSTGQLLSERVQLNIRFAPVFMQPARRLNWPIEKLHGGSTDQRLVQYIVVEGSNVDLRLEPWANPKVTKLSWFKNEKPLPSSTTAPSEYSDRHGTDDENMSRYRVHTAGSRLQIQNVHDSDMANYTIMATNIMGSTQFQFFLNVTYGPRLIGPQFVNITVSGQKAVLECQAMANPKPTENAVRWRRLSHSYTGLDPLNKLYGRSGDSVDVKSGTIVQQQSQADSVQGIRCNKGKWHDGFKYFANCWSPSPGVLSSSLTIYNLGPRDVGRYQCHMDNAVGSPAVRIVDLIYPFAPQVFSIPRWSRAASGPVDDSLEQKFRLHSVPGNISADAVRQYARLTCVMAAEPKPTVEWIREPANLTLVEGGRFQSEIVSVHPGLYHAILYVLQPRDVDLGRYYCKSTNMVGEDVGLVDFVTSSKPDLPSTPRLLNATSNSLAVGWTQGYNGGPMQKFKLRWSPNESPEQFSETDVDENLESETISHIIRGLQKMTSYRVAVSSTNALHGSTGFTQYLVASTTAHDPVPDKEAMHDEARAKSRTSKSGGHWSETGEYEGVDEYGEEDYQKRAMRAGLEAKGTEDRVVAIIVAASIFGSLILVVNLLVILLLARRRRRKAHQQRKNSLYTGNELMQLCPAGQGFTEINPNSGPSFTGYPDGGSLVDENLLQTRSSDQFSPMHSGLGPMAINVCMNENRGYLHRNQSFTGSPHPSLQAVNPLSMPSPNHPMEFNTTLHLPITGLTESDMTGLTYLNTEMSQHPTQPFLHYGPVNDMLFQGMSARSGNTSELRYARGGGQMDPTVGQFQTTVPRVDSPLSGTASNLSTTNRSVGYSAVHSLERNGCFLTPRPISNQPPPSLVRQWSLGQNTNPCNTFGRGSGACGTASYGTSMATNNPENTNALICSTFTPVHTPTFNGNSLQPNSMAASYYADKGLSSAGDGFVQTNGGGDKLSPTVMSCQLIRRASQCASKETEMSQQRMNTSQLLDAYLQRYNDQLQNAKSLGQPPVPERTVSDFQSRMTATKECRIAQNPVCFDNLNTTEGSIIPPPNAFDSTNNVQYSPNGLAINNGVDVHLPPLGTPRPSFRIMGGQAGNSLAPNNNTDTVCQPNYSPNPPVKHPTINQNLVYTNDGQTQFSQFGCIV